MRVKKETLFLLFTLPKVAPLHPEFSLSTFFLAFFFAPSAVRPNSPVTVEQKHDPSPIKAKSPIDAGADDRIPPSQECSPHPGRKQQEKQQNTTSKNAKTGERGLDAVQ